MSGLIVFLLSLSEWLLSSFDYIIHSDNGTHVTPRLSCIIVPNLLLTSDIDLVVFFTFFLTGQIPHPLVHLVVLHHACDNGCKFNRTCHVHQRCDESCSFSKYSLLHSRSQVFILHDFYSVVG